MSVFYTIASSSRSLGRWVSEPVGVIQSECLNFLGANGVAAISGMTRAAGLRLPVEPEQIDRWHRSGTSYSGLRVVEEFGSAARTSARPGVLSTEGAVRVRES